MAQRDYYDIDDILAGQERVPCLLRVDLDGLGTAGSGTSKVQRNQRWALPYWMGERLDTEGFIEMSTPAVFSKRANRMYAASATSMQLRAVSPHYYKFGLQLADIVPGLPAVLRSMYMERVQKIAQISQQGQNVEGLEFVQSLDRTETLVLQKCQAAQGAIAEWQHGAAYKLNKAGVF
ncbi:DNA replication protein [Linderina macrospora]|uniref:DNA replication protein n=1 Tax=Linderina macrospora TaxID=4868 RepID=A0ACC1JBF2_9FUNG|nr:DNA replication protein [Linderina macrospora]